MNLPAVGHLVAERRRAQGLTLQTLARQAQVGRSTLAAFEAGTLGELGYGRVTRICNAVGLVLEARPMALEKPLAPHRHLTDVAARELTKAAIEDIVVRGDIDSWRGLLRAMRQDASGRLARRARDVLARSDLTDPRVRAFAALLSRRIRPSRENSAVAEGKKVHDWEKLLAHAAMVQERVPNAILVGGTAAALHAGHRVSFAHDHVLKDLAANYEQALAALESIAGWRTKRRVRGKLVLGEIAGIDAGLRGQRRSAPLETTSMPLPGGKTLRVPTVEEMLRIKAFLTVERNATRDYLDVAALSHHLGTARSARAVEKMRDLYAEFAGEIGDIMVSVVVKLTTPDPYDLSEVDLSEYKGIIAPWNSWTSVERQCRLLATAILSG